MAKISVLVPLYNVEKYLRRCLDSILKQTFSDLEILCMDDGSTDSSGTILDEYANKDSRIKVIHKKNTGYGNTMNQAISMASGEYIGIVESDDYIAADMYEKLYAAADRWDLDIVKTDFYKLWEQDDGTIRTVYCALTDHAGMYGRVLKPYCEKEAYFMEKFTWNALYRRSFISKYGIQYNETSGASFQDNGFWFQTFYFAKRVMFLKQAFYYYKQDNMASSINCDRKVYAMKDEYDFIRDFLTKQGEQDKIFYKICFYFRIQGYIYTLNMLANRYRWQLAKTLAKECDWYEEAGEAAFEWFSKDKQEMLQQIRKNPLVYVEEQLCKNRRILEKVSGYRRIIIYGAGTYGKRVYEALKLVLDRACMIEFAVTCLEGKEQQYDNKIIKEITEFSEWKENCLVILSVKNGSPVQQEMERKLRDMQFRNVISHQDIGDF